MDPGWYYVNYPRNYKFIIDNANVCQKTSPFLVVMVPVAPGESDARNAIRETWGNEKPVLGRQVVTLFFLGLPAGSNKAKLQEKLVEENRRHRDLIQSDFQDSYHNLTIKTMMMLEWLNVSCGSASYVMKIDSDVFLSVRNLVKLLVDPSTAKQNYITGLVWWHSKVSRNIFNKFYMPRSVIADAEYAPYPLGMSYVMSSDVPRKIVGVAPHIKPLFIEDVYLGMCLKHLGIEPTDPPQETMFIVDPSHPVSSCSLSKAIALMTDNIAQMRNYWRISLQPDTNC